MSLPTAQDPRERVAPGRPRGLRALVLVALALLCACSSYPDKRLLQYLNTDGFGKRYTGNAEEENYITIGDTLQIFDSYHSNELGADAVVDIDGTVLLVELGAVQVAGMTRTEIEALLMEKYSPYFDLLDIKVRINAKGKNYFVFGEVSNEGEKPFKGDLTLFEAVMPIYKSDSANLGRVQLIRADPRDPRIITADLTDMFRGDSTFNVHVQELDIIYVPPTMLAQLGYFIDTLLFPVRQVLQGMGGALFGLRGGRRRMGGGGFGGGGFGGGGFGGGGIF
ncbi:MAG TPA: polysaccharide biosynthesis/export family protein [Planctomycetota bacterium]|nr:polysaccharide biosynthesis/export family protein [Planctomycetota bacterium]